MDIGTQHLAFMLGGWQSSLERYGLLDCGRSSVQQQSRTSTLREIFCDAYFRRSGKNFSDHASEVQGSLSEAFACDNPRMSTQYYAEKSKILYLFEDK